MEIIATIFYTLLFTWIICHWKFFKFENVPAYSAEIIFVLKIVTGIIAAWYFCTFRGGSDTDLYMFETNSLFDGVKNQPLLFLKFIFGTEDASTLIYTKAITSWNVPDFIYNDARTLLRFNLVVRLFSFGHTWVHVVFFCFALMIGFGGLFRFFEKHVDGKKLLLLFAVFYIPSVFFWTSLVLKESLLIFGLGIFLFALSEFLQGRTRKKYLIAAIASFLFLLTIKPFVILLLIPALSAFYLSRQFSFRKTISGYMLVYGCVILFLITLGNISDKYYLPHAIALKQQSSMKFAIFTGNKNYFQPPIVAESWISIFRNSPKAIANVFTIPSIADSKNILQIIAALENYFLILVFVLPILFAGRITSEKFNFLLFCFAFAFSYFSLIGLTTADSGALIRYKIPGLIFLFVGCVAVLKQKEKISSQKN